MNSLRGVNYSNEAIWESEEFTINGQTVWIGTGKGRNNGHGFLLVRHFNSKGVLEFYLESYPETYSIQRATDLQYKIAYPHRAVMQSKLDTIMKELGIES